jgi:hypothetical protein
MSIAFSPRAAEIELKAASSTDGQRRALPAHKRQQAREGYAKRTMERSWQLEKRRARSVRERPRKTRSE